MRVCLDSKGLIHCPHANCQLTLPQQTDLVAALMQDA
jgi:hypothetical protein